MNPKRLMVYSAVVWILFVGLGSYIDIRFDHAWWAQALAHLIRGLPLGAFLVGFMLWTEERSKQRRRKPPEVED